MDNKLLLSKEQSLHLEELRKVLLENGGDEKVFPTTHYATCGGTCFYACDGTCWPACTGRCIGCVNQCSGCTGCSGCWGGCTGVIN